jgi:drug/metabolite transporter (DMT)-like permease
MSRRGWVLFISLSIIWGTPYFFIKVAVADMEPQFIVAARLAIAALVLVPIAIRSGGLGELRGHWPVIFTLAIVEMVIPFGLLTWAETKVTSSLAGMVIAAVPTLTAGIAATLGLLLGLDVGASILLAVLALLGVALGYAIGPILVNTRLGHLPGPAVMGAATTIAALVYLPWLVLSFPGTDASAASWASVGTLGLICTAVAFLVFFALVAEVGPTRTSVITYLNPVVALALGVTVLGEPITIGMILGFPLVLLGSVIATRAPRAVAETLGPPPTSAELAADHDPANETGPTR